jgi:hypothetical protein
MENPAHVHDACVVLRRLIYSEDFIRVRDHRTKFIGPETTPSPTPAFLSVKYLTPVFEFDGQGNEEGYRSREDEHQAR